jgi:hypothetical protein
MYRGVILSMCVIVALSVLTLALVFAEISPAQGPKVGDVITGSDLGFRIDEIKGDRVGGTIVVRVKGQWAPVAPIPLPSVPGVVPAKP